MSEAEEINRLKKKRGIIRASVTKVINKLESELASSNIDTDSIELLIEHLKEKTEKLKIADSELEKLLPVDDIENELGSVEEYCEKITTCQFLAKKKIEKLNRDSSKKNASQSVSGDHESESKFSARIQTVKLPKLTVQKFSGELNEWLSFWNSFKSAIHENTSLNDIDKFNYLKAFLDGKALNAVSGLMLSEENYQSAIKILLERFGNKDLLINCHMDELLKTESLKNSNDVKNFRRMFDNITKNVRSLENLEVTSEKYSTILVPILLKNLPQDLILEYNTNYIETHSNDIENLLEFLSKQLIARERSNFSPQNNNESKMNTGYALNKQAHLKRPKLNYSYPNKSASALITTGSNENKTDACIFCRQTDHKSNLCVKANLLTHAEKINRCKTHGFCFRCAKASHLKSLCFAKIRCDICESSTHADRKSVV